MPRNRFGGLSFTALVGAVAAVGGLVGILLLIGGIPGLGSRGTIGSVAPSDTDRNSELVASAPLTTPTGVAPPTVVPTGTITITPEITVTATTTGTIGVTETPLPTETLTPTNTPIPTLAPTATPTAIAAYTPFLARDHQLQRGARRVWGAQFAADDIPELLADVRAHELERLRRTGIGAIRTHLYWDAIAPTRRGVEAFDWAATDERLRAYSTEAGGFDLVLSVVSYPKWAMTYRCGAGFEPGGEDALREFMRVAASRYGRAPYRVVAWEIGNEVDGETTIDPSDWERTDHWGRGEPTVPHGGCWGDRPEEYVRFLGIAAEAVRAADPDALVTLGNLALVVHEDFHADFMERFLAAGGGEMIDYFGYHWFPDLKDFFPDQDLPSGEEKARRAAESLSRSGSRMPLWLSETYRLSKMGEPDTERAQLRFVTRELPRLLAMTDLRHIFWYGWLDFAGVPNGTFQRGIVRPDHSPKPALRPLATIIRATDGSPTDLSDGRVEAYRFNGRDGAWIVAWSRDGSSVPFAVEVGPDLEAVGWLLDESAIVAGTAWPEVRAPSSGGAITLRVGRDTLALRLQPTGAAAPDHVGD